MTGQLDDMTPPDAFAGVGALIELITQRQEQVQQRHRVGPARNSDHYQPRFKEPMFQAVGAYLID